MWEGVVIPVPAAPPTNLGGNCQIISVTYTLDFRVIPSGIGTHLVVQNLHLTIGTIPLQESLVITSLDE